MNTTMNTPLLIGVILISLAAIALVSILVFLGIWTYKDAKSRGLNAPLWTLIVILGSNTMLGLLLYILIGRRESKITCPECAGKTSSKAVYCDHCGKAIDRSRVIPGPSAKKWLVAMLTAFLVFIVGFGGGIAVITLNHANPGLPPNISFGKVETDFNNTWKLNYYASTETMSKTISINENGPKSLYFKGACEEGTMVLVVIMGDEIKTFNVTGQYEESMIDLSQYDTRSVTLQLINSDVQNGEFEAHWG